MGDGLREWPPFGCNIGLLDEVPFAEKDEEDDGSGGKGDLGGGVSGKE